MDRHDPGVFVGREAELERLSLAIHRRESLAIWGPPDSGKTALVQHAISRLPGDVAARCIHLTVKGPPHAVLATLLEELHTRGDEFLIAKFQSEEGETTGFARWARHQTSLRMRGLLYRAAQSSRYWLFLDGVEGLSDAFARIVRELVEMRGTPVYLIARGCSERELGRAARLYWNDTMRLKLAPLAAQGARSLVKHCIERYGLTRLNLEGFREELLRLSGGLPGAIVEMSARAGDSEYHRGGRIEMRLLHVDYMMQFSYRAQPIAAARPGVAATAPDLPGERRHGALK